jgi:hypothetical protein
VAGAGGKIMITRYFVRSRRFEMAGAFVCDGKGSAEIRMLEKIYTAKKEVE